MSDSFFTARNQFDPQVQGFDAFTSAALLEACVRRLVILQGPIEAARVSYRLADICAGAHIVPIEALAKPNPPPPQEAAPPPAARPDPKKARRDRAPRRGWWDVGGFILVWGLVLWLAFG